MKTVFLKIKEPNRKSVTQYENLNFGRDPRILTKYFWLMNTINYDKLAEISNLMKFGY